VPASALRESPCASTPSTALPHRTRPFTVAVDPSFHRQLELPDPTLLDAVEARTESESRLYYQFIGHLGRAEADAQSP